MTDPVFIAYWATKIIVAVIVGLIPATIAARKGRDFTTWWIYGALVFIIALPHALIMKPRQPHSNTVKVCQRCSATIEREAFTCRYCGAAQTTGAEHPLTRAPVLRAL